MKKKSIAVVLALVLLVCCAVGGVLAWLTDTTDSIKNTFTVGNVDISLTETTGNSYKMVPGQTIAKDPKVTVNANSEDCYLFVKVEEADNLPSFIDYSIDNDWTVLDGVDGVYYMTVTASTDDQTFSVLTGDQVTVNDDVTKTMMDELNDETLPTLTFTAYACQSAGFDNALAAWNANFAPAP